MKLLIPALFITMLISCDRPACDNTNPVFDENPVTSQVYKEELVKQLNNRDADGIRYWLKGYEDRNNKAYLQFYVQGDNLCAVADVLVTLWDEKLSGIKRTKGVSYAGAEISGVKFSVEKDSAHIELVYVSLGAIID